MQMREKVGKSRNSVFFKWFVAPEGRKVGSLKRRVPSHLARWEMKNCTPLWHEAHFEVKMYKAHHSRTIFGSWDVEKVHAVVARSTFRSQNVQNTPGPDHFWKFRCWKRACRCGAKHISKSKCKKHNMFGPLLEVAMSKKCTPLWREAHFEVNMYKTHHVRTTFGSCDVERVHAVVARSTFRSEHVRNTRVRTTFGSSDVVCVAGARDGAPCQKWAKREGFVAFLTTTTTTPHYTPIHYTTTTTPSLHSSTLHYTTLHYITLNYTQVHYTALHYITFHYTTLHYATLRSTTLHYITLHYAPLHYTTLHYTTFHYTTLHYTTLHCTTLQLRYTTLHSAALRYTPLHYTQLHYTTLHYTTLQNASLYYTPLHSVTLHYTTLHYTTLDYATVHYTTFHYTTLD